jgi:hypothetical protein
MASINTRPWRAKDYASVPQDDEPVELLPEPGQVPEEADGGGSSSRESLQQASSLLSAEHNEESYDSAEARVAHDTYDWNVDEEKSKSSFYLFLLTISIGG